MSKSNKTKTYGDGISVADAAQKLHMTQKQLFDYLRAEGILFKEGKNNVPQHDYEQAGWFVLKQRSFWQNATEHKSITVFITPVGIQQIQERIATSEA